MTDFDPEFVNTKQALNLIHNFINRHFINSEIHVNDLIVFLKDHYAENSLEKNSKLEKVNMRKHESSRTNRFSTCFDKLDNEGSGILNLNNLIDSLEHFKDGLFKDQVTKGIVSKITNFILKFLKNETSFHI